MRVLIVAKTKMRNNTCIGALDLKEGESLRLLDEEGKNWPLNVDFDVGDVWEIKIKRPEKVTPPHIEDVIVTKKEFLYKCSNAKETIQKLITPWKGGVEALFNGLLKFTTNRSAYISLREPLPDRSTWFWIPDKDLEMKETLEEYSGDDMWMIVRKMRKIRYYYPSIPPFRVAFVGFQTPIKIIPKGTLIRVSLSRPSSKNEFLKDKCFLQISGWFL